MNPAQDPQEVVQRVSDGLMRVLREDRGRLETDPGYVHRLVDELFMPNVDFDRVASLVLGPFWRDASAQQREGFRREFKAMLIHTYASALNKLSEWEIRYPPLHLEPGQQALKDLAIPLAAIGAFVIAKFDDRDRGIVRSQRGVVIDWNIVPLDCLLLFVAGLRRWKELRPDLVVLDKDKKEIGRGSAVVLSETVAVTSFHLVCKAAEVTGFNALKKKVDIEGLLAVDKNLDLALLQIDGNVKILTPGPALSTAQSVIALGANESG